MSRLGDILKKLILPSDESLTVTATKGELVSVSAKRLGNLVLVTYAGRNAAATTAGANLVEGTQNGLTPPWLVNGIGYIGSTACVLQLLANGGITVRATGSGVSANATVYVSAVYILGGGYCLTALSHLVERFYLVTSPKGGVVHE